MILTVFDHTYSVSFTYVKDTVHTCTYLISGPVEAKCAGNIFAIFTGRFWNGSGWTFIRFRPTLECF